jgi:hypothetical protein
MDKTESVKAIKYHFKEKDIGVFNTGNIDTITALMYPKCQVFGFTDGKFSLIDVIYAVLKKIGKSDIVICTWSAGIKDSHNIKWMLETNMINTIKIITDMSFPSRKKNYSVAIDELFGTENIRMARVHAKFVLLKNEHWNIVINTSMNLNANKTVENFQIIDDLILYDFMNKYCDVHFENQSAGFVVPFAQIQKSYKTFVNSQMESEKEWWKF